LDTRLPSEVGYVTCCLASPAGTRRSIRSRLMHRKSAPGSVQHPLASRSPPVFAAGSTDIPPACQPGWRRPIWPPWRRGTDGNRLRFGRVRLPGRAVAKVQAGPSTPEVPPVVVVGSGWRDRAGELELNPAGRSAPAPLEIARRRAKRSGQSPSPVHQRRGARSGIGRLHRGHTRAPPIGSRACRYATRLPSEVGYSSAWGGCNPPARIRLSGRRPARGSHSFGGRGPSPTQGAFARCSPGRCSKACASGNRVHPGACAARFTSCHFGCRGFFCKAAKWSKNASTNRATLL